MPKLTPKCSDTCVCDAIETAWPDREKVIKVMLQELHATQVEEKALPKSAFDELIGPFPKFVREARTAQYCIELMSSLREKISHAKLAA